MGKRTFEINGFYLFFGILSDHFYIAAQWKGTQSVFGFALLFNPQLGPKSDRKRQNSDSGKFREKKMSELVKYDEHAKADHRRYYRIEQIFHIISLGHQCTSNVARSLAHRSTSRISSTFRALRRMALHRFLDSS